MKQILWLFILLIAACHSSDSDSVRNPPTLSDAKVIKAGCLNLELIKQELSQNYPSQEITINYQPDAQLENESQNFHLLASHDERTIQSSEIIDFYKVQQNDCRTVTIESRNQDIYKFDIMEATANQLKLKISESSKKLIVSELDLTRLSETEMLIKKTYLSFNAHCRSQKFVKPKVTTYYSFGRNDQPAELDPEFQKSYLASLEDYRLNGHAPCTN